MTPRLAASLVLILPLLAVGCGSGTTEADCSAVTIEAVSAAAAAVPGYTFRLEGTDQVAETVVRDRQIAYEYSTAPVEAEGAYAAPDQARLTILEGMLELPPRHSSVFGDLWPPYAVGYVRVGGEMWLHRSGGGVYYPADLPYLFAANTLEAVLQGAPYRAELAGAEPRSDSASMEWAVEPREGSCRLTGTLVSPMSPPPSPPLEVVVVAAVDPSTMLPSSVAIRRILPWSQLGQPTSYDVEFELTCTFDYQDAEAIEAPSNVGPRPTG